MTNNTDNISKKQYEYALNRVEELLPLVTDSTPSNSREAVELSVLSDVVIEYETKHYPICILPSAMLGL